MFYNPKGYKILPYKNTYGQDGQVQYTGYFIPAYTMWFGDDEGNVGFDERGVVDEERAKQYFIKGFEEYEDQHALLVARAEYCFTPEDAFILEGSNRFDQELLVEQYNNITIHKTVPGPQAARLSWNINTETGGVDKDKRPKIEFISDGPLKVIELPKLDESGVPEQNLYVAGCLTPGEKVQTVSGLKNCEDVTLDDQLYSIQGNPVNIINLQQYYKENEDIYKVKLNNIFRTTTFTGEHPIYCATPEKHYHSKHKAQTYNLPYTYYKYNFGFKLMKDVKVGDFVKVPNIYKLEKPIPFDKWDESKVRIDFRVGNPLSNPDFWWLIGLLLGDGWAESNNPRVCVVFNKQEQFYIDKAKRIVNTLFGRTFNIQKKDKSVECYSINCKYLNKFFSENFGRGAKNKHIPEWVKFLPAELKLNLVMGYLASDGCVCVSSNSLNFVSCSYELLEGIQDILFSLGIINTVHWLRSIDKYYKVANSKKVNHISKAWTLDVHGDMINKFKRMVPYSDLKLDKWQYKEFANHAIPRCFFEDESCDYIYIKISGIEHSKYTGVVYNYHCETSTFMCKYIPTHNCDAIDADNSTSTGQTDVSKFCVIIYKRAFGIDPPKPVAIYCERPQHIQTAFENALKLCAFYNCKLLVEATRISIKQYFEKEHKLNYLMRRPQATANKTTRTNFKQYGVPATEAIIQHQLDLIEQYIVDYSTEIQFPELLDELIKYSYENKRKFDRVAAFGIVLLADEDMIGKTAKKQSFSGENIINLSYYKNDYGQIEFGVLEKQGTRREDQRDDLWNLWE